MLQRNRATAHHDSLQHAESWGWDRPSGVVLPKTGFIIFPTIYLTALALSSAVLTHCSLRRIHPFDSGRNDRDRTTWSAFIPFKDASCSKIHIALAAGRCLRLTDSLRLPVVPPAPQFTDNLLPCLFVVICTAYPNWRCRGSVAPVTCKEVTMPQSNAWHLLQQEVGIPVLLRTRARTRRRRRKRSWGASRAY